jgi:glycerol kinase
MMNTGYDVPIPSTNGLLSTVAFKLGGDLGRVAYALEGSVAFSGSVIQWLRDQLQIISSAPESEELAKSVKTNDSLYLVLHLRDCLRHIGEMTHEGALLE